MALVTVEFDTKSKAMSCKIDGKAVKDAMSVHLGRGRYEDPDKAFCTISTSAENKDEGMYTWTQICASELVDDAASFAQSDYVEFVQASLDVKPKVYSDIAEYFAK